MKTCHILLCSLVAAASASAQVTQRATCVAAQEPIQVDGLLGEASWQDAAPVGPFVLDETGASPPYATTARLLWDPQYLYIAFVVEDEEVEDKRGMRDFFDPFGQDGVVVVVDPDGDGRELLGWQLTASNSLTDFSQEASGETMEIDWDGEGVHTDVHIAEGDSARVQWFAEMAIPWAAVGGEGAVPPGVESRWRIGLFRRETVADSYTDLYAWSPSMAHRLEMKYAVFAERLARLPLLRSRPGWRCRARWRT